jgi:hypothetical protein
VLFTKAEDRSFERIACISDDIRKELAFWEGLAAAHHARGPDRPAQDGLRDRARQEPARQDGLPAAGSGARLDQASL